jgi:hypothetical protein
LHVYKKAIILAACNTLTQSQVMLYFYLSRRVKRDKTSFVKFGFSDDKAVSGYVLALKFDGFGNTQPCAGQQGKQGTVGV